MAVVPVLLLLVLVVLLLLVLAVPLLSVLVVLLLSVVLPLAVLVVLAHGLSVTGHQRTPTRWLPWDGRRPRLATAPPSALHTPSASPHLPRQASRVRPIR